MKKVLYVLIVTLMVPLVQITAQNSNLEKFNTYKVGFFTKKMNLTSHEAEKFWPVYNEYQRKKNLIQRDKIMIIRDFNRNENALNENQLSGMGDNLIKDLSDESALAVAFHRQIKEILPPAKVIRYYQAENQYKIQLLRELQENRQQHRGDSELDFN